MTIEETDDSYKLEETDDIYKLEKMLHQAQQAQRAHRPVLLEPEDVQLICRTLIRLSKRGTTDAT